MLWQHRDLTIKGHVCHRQTHCSRLGVRREMNRVNPAGSSEVAREGLEDLWRLKLDGANRRFQAASAQYKRLLAETPESLASDGSSPLTRARQARSEAKNEYSRVLKIFTELTISGRIPEESSTEHGGM